MKSGCGRLLAGLKSVTINSMKQPYIARSQEQTVRTVSKAEDATSCRGCWNQTGFVNVENLVRLAIQVLEVSAVPKDQKMVLWFGVTGGDSRGRTRGKPKVIT